MKNLFIFGLLFFVHAAMAAKLEDVKILDVTTSATNIKLKLQAKTGPANSYFFVDVVKSDPESFEKLAFVTNKIAKPDSYRLDLDIPNFSVAPNGSYYRSEGLGFDGFGDREPNSAAKKKKSQ